MVFARVRSNMLETFHYHSENVSVRCGIRYKSVRYIFKHARNEVWACKTKHTCFEVKNNKSQVQLNCLAAQIRFHTEGQALRGFPDLGRLLEVPILNLGEKPTKFSSVASDRARYVELWPELAAQVFRVLPYPSRILLTHKPRCR